MSADKASTLPEPRTAEESYQAFYFSLIRKYGSLANLRLRNSETWEKHLKKLVDETKPVTI